VAQESTEFADTAWRGEKMHMYPKDTGPIRPETDRCSRAAESQTLDPAVAQRIRGRIQSGAYERVAVIDRVARAVLESGDL